MFDFSWSEVLLIAAVALIVIGPKDLPRVLRTVGRYVRQARSIAREFQGTVEQMVRDSELDDVRREIGKVTDFNIGDEVRKTVDPDGAMQRAFDDPTLPSASADAAPLPGAPAGEAVPDAAPAVDALPTPGLPLAEALPPQPAALVDAAAPPPDAAPRPDSSH